MITEIKNRSDINEAIASLERSKELQKKILREHFEQKIQSLKPANLIKSVVGQVTTKPTVKKWVLITAGGLATAMVLKKILSNRRGGKSFLYMALSGAGTMLVKKLLAKK